LSAPISQGSPGKAGSEVAGSLVPLGEDDEAGQDRMGHYPPDPLTGEASTGELEVPPTLAVLAAVQRCVTELISRVLGRR